MKRAPIYVTFLIAGAFFMENLDGTIIATALPQIAGSFHISAVSLNIGMTAYLLTLAVFIPISGWVADRLGSRSVFASAIAIFTLSSVLCGFCHSLAQFTIMRIIQGLGGAMMVPVGRLIVLRNTPKSELAKAITYITWPGLTALVLGPPIGGFITTYWNWRWIFFLNLPLGAIALVLALLWIENVRAGERHPFDWLTFIFAGVASSGTVFAMEKLGGGDTHWQIPTTILCISIVCGILAVFAARRKPATSFVDLESMKIKTYALSVYGASSFRLAAAVLPFLLPLMFQIVFGLSAFRSGLYLIGLFIGDFSMKSMVLQSLRLFGFRRILIVNGTLVAATMMCCCFINPATPPILILLILFVHGASRSMQFTCMTTIAYSEIPAARMSRANGFLSAVMQLSLGMGIAAGAVTLRIIAHAHGHSVAVPGLRDFHEAIFLMSLLALGPVINSIGLPPDAGATTSGHRHAQLEVNPA